MPPVHSSALELPFKHSIERTAAGDDEVEEENRELSDEDDECVNRSIGIFRGGLISSI